MRKIFAAMCALALVGLPMSAGAQTVLPCDYCTGGFTDWGAANGFSKLFGGDVRWGDAGGAAEWELGVVRPNNSTLVQRGFDWTSTAPRDAFFSYASTSSHFASLMVGGRGIGSVDVSSLVGTASVNTLLIRVADKLGAGISGSAALRDYQVQLAGGGILGGGTIVGDGDAEYVLFQDAALADGFTVRGTIDYTAPDGRHGSRLVTNFKVGTSRVPVPEPASGLLFLTGLAGLAAAGRRRDDGGTAI